MKQIWKFIQKRKQMVDMTTEAEKVAMGRKRWDQMSDWYANAVERFSGQSLVTCLEMTDVRSQDRVLEVACGPGLHSETIAKGYLKKGGSLLVSCDFSKEMVTKTKERFANSEFITIPGCKAIIDNETDYVVAKKGHKMNVDEQVGSIENRAVFGCIADNMNLPFPDQYFGAYVANLSLMIVPNK